MKEKNSSVTASAFRYVVIVLRLFLHVFNHSPTSFVSLRMREGPVDLLQGWKKVKFFDIL